MKITIEKLEYELVDNWYDMKLYQLEQINNIDPLLEEIDKTIEIIHILSLIPKDTLYSLPYTEYKKLLDIVSFIQIDPPEKLLEAIDVEGTIYKFNCSLDNMTTAEYVDMDHLIKENNLSMLMAILYRPENNKYNSKELKTRSEILKKYMPVSAVISAQVFMEIFAMELSIIIEGYSTQNNKI